MPCLFSAALAAAPVAPVRAHLAPHHQIRVLLTQPQALQRVFPEGAPMERRRAYLTEEDARKVEAAAGTKLESRVWTYYVGTSTSGVQSYAYFEKHVVYMAPEVIMAVLDAQGRLLSVELLTFDEAEEHRPRPRWDRTEGVRRILAVHALLHAKP